LLLCIFLFSFFRILLGIVLIRLLFFCSGEIPSSKGSGRSGKSIDHYKAQKLRRKKN
jgi:hypothetical protein